MISFKATMDFIRERFDLTSDSAQESVVVENITKGIEFGGTNLWILIFATFVASLGLNVNSTAVIIGAMLISPLMGPIMGIGLSLGINNFELFKRSLRNFGFMIGVSLLTSTLYFWISPMNYAQSELLARTTPTTYDVLIAFFGGLAGFVAQSRVDRVSTVIPGVAIATALMPPLCTAGFGLATGNVTFFFGALYLFLINTVFIAFATYFIVRFLKYSPKEFLDKQREKQVKRYMVIILFCAFVPSVILAYRIINRTNFENEADKYVATVFNFSKTIVIDVVKKYHVEGKGSEIELVLVGEPLTQQLIDVATKRLTEFGLKDTKLIINQTEGVDKVDLTTINKNIAQILDEKNSQIISLEKRLLSLEVDSIAAPEIAREANVVIGNIESMSLNRDISYDAKGQPVDTAIVCIVMPMDAREGVSREKLTQWLRVRLNSSNVKVYIDNR